MRIIIVWGKEEKCLDRIMPKKQLKKMLKECLDDHKM